ncbi:MAG TPA: alpha/beta hydrolase [Gallionellaceae bacterium]
MTTWVLLRGLMREMRHWGEFPEVFQNTVGAKRVVTLDFPGNGRLHAQTSPASVAAIAEHVRAQLRQLGHAPPYSVLALSLGAMVAVAWSESYPAELERMVLINTSLAPYNPFYYRLRPANYPALIRSLFHDSARREALILRFTSAIKNRAEFRQPILDQWIAYAKEYPVAPANILRQLKAAMLYRAAQTPPPIPVLLLAGRQDQLVNVKCSLALAQQWHCPISLHPTAGHDLPLDDGAWVARQVKEWPASKPTGFW